MFARLRVVVAAPVCAAFVFTTLTVTCPSRADDADKARAVQLFLDGKQLMEKGQYIEACPKLEESLHLVPADGTLLRYAWCEEMIGKLATAWGLFNQGLALAKKANNDERIKFASEHIAGIEPKLSKVTIHIPNAAQVDGLEIRWDGRIVGKSGWDSEFPVDPGNHALSATAPGKQIWTTTIGVGTNADRRIVEIPQLTELTAAGSSTAGSAAGDKTTSGHPAVAYVAIGAGVVFIGGAIGSQLLASSAMDSRRADCLSQHTVTCDDTGKSKVRTWETLSFVSGGLALVSLGVGIYLYTSGSTSEKPKGTSNAFVRVEPTFSGVQLEGAF